MAVPVVQSFTNAIATGTSVAVAYPSGIVAGDLLIVIGESDATSAQWAAYAPSGFTRRTSTGGNVEFGVWWRIADGSESGNISVATTASCNLIAWCLRISGAAVTSPISQLGTAYSTGGASSHAVTGITTANNDCLAVVLLVFNGGDAGSFGFSGTGWTKSDERYSPGTAAADVSGTWGTKDQPTAGATGTCTITTANADIARGIQFVVERLPDPGTVRRHRTIKPADVDPTQLRGRTTRRLAHGEDYIPPDRPGRARRKVRPLDIDPQSLAGRVVRRWFNAPNYVPQFGPKKRRIEQSPPHPNVLRGRTTRRQRRIEVLVAEIALLAELAISVEAELALRADLDVFASDTYRVILRNLLTGEETVLGTGTSLADVEIADGDYVLRVEADGRFWQGARFRTEYAVSISGGELVVALPPIVGLRAQVSGTTMNVGWKIEPLAGTSAPEDFAVWVSDTSPVNTAGSPAAVATWTGIGGYLVQLASSPTVLFIAVAARLGAQRGPVSEVAVTGEAGADPTAPTAVSGRIPNREWSES